MKHIHEPLLKNIGGLCLLIAIILLTILLWPFFKSLGSPEGIQAFEATVDRIGIWGIALIFGIQVLQIVVALIPGEVVEFVSGVMYSSFGGLIVCLAGVLAGQWIIFQLVRILGKSFAEWVNGKGKLDKFKFLHNTKKLELLTFVLFFIPGTPKDLLTYFMPLTKLKLTRFLMISTVARIPSILSSTYAGATFMTGNFTKVVIIYSIIGIISIAGILLHNKYFNRKKVDK